MIPTISDQLPSSCLHWLAHGCNDVCLSAVLTTLRRSSHSVAVQLPHQTDAAGHDTLYCTPIEGGEDGRWELVSSPPVETVPSLTCCLDQSRSVLRQSVVPPGNRCSSSHSTAMLLMSSGVWWVNNDLLCCVDIQDEVVFPTPVHKLFNLLHVSVPANQAHYCCVISVWTWRRSRESSGWRAGGSGHICEESQCSDLWRRRWFLIN